MDFIALFEAELIDLELEIILVLTFDINIILAAAEKINRPEH